MKLLYTVAPFVGLVYKHNTHVNLVARPPPPAAAFQTFQSLLLVYTPRFLYYYIVNQVFSSHVVVERKKELAIGIIEAAIAELFSQYNIYTYTV